MTFLNGDVLIPFLPVTLLLITLEIIMSIYRSSVFTWTTKLAICNLIVNLLWIGLIVVVIIKPNLFNPDFLLHLSELYNSSLENTTTVVKYIMNAIVIAVILTNIIDVFTGFFNVKRESERDQI